MAFWVYMLECADNSLYVGQTDNLERRLAEHHCSHFKGFTSARLPVRLVWSQEFPSRDEAFVRERQIKKWSKAKKRALAAGEWGLLSDLARGPDWDEVEPGPSTTSRLRQRSDPLWARLRSG